jgi:quercetin dioxygenase-like cupin family protein
VESILDPAYVLKSFSISDMHFAEIAPTVVLLTYKATETGTDHGKPLPSPLYISSVWVNKNGKWMNVLYQDTPEAPASSSSQERQTLAQESGEHAIVNKAASAHFVAVPNAPACVTVGVERSDPGKGASEMLAKFASGCAVPLHWKTPNESAVVVSGVLEIEMKGEKPFVMRRGDYSFLSSHLVHRTTCKGKNPCLVYVYLDGSVEIHYVDEAGKDIPPGEVLAGICALC